MHAKEVEMKKKKGDNDLSHVITRWNEGDEVEMEW
jgi:hypothetical protein